jgi:mRNA deadenylase 3'-5' endonuclease subunit Ccr4
MAFLAATYNVLATAYTQLDRYESVPEKWLRPGWRVSALVRHVAELDADLLCLQEVEDDSFAALQEGLAPLGYEGHFKKKGRGKPDGCATFYCASTFSLRRVERLAYHDGQIGCGSDSGHVALLLCLEHQGQLLGVANTHVRWDRPGLSLTQHVGYRQVVELLEACDRFPLACRGWLVCGDFNQTCDSDVVAAMRQAGFEHAHANRPQPRSCVANGRAHLIDYLFHSPELRSAPIDPPTIRDDALLPSEDQPSDHLALLTELDWTARAAE